MKSTFFLAVCTTVIMAITACLATASTESDLFDKGVAHVKENRLEEAIDTFSQLIDLVPDNAAVYKNRGVVYMKQKLYDKAIKDFETARELNPELDGLFSNLGVAYYYKKNYEKAIEYYNLEIETNPGNHIAFFNRGLCHSEQKNIDSALNDMEQALLLKPDFFWAGCYKGDLLAKQGRTKKAKQAYEQVLALEPEHPYARKKLAALPDPQAAETEPGAPGPEQTGPEDKRTGPEDSGKTVKSPYFIQAGAFSNPENAENLCRELVDKEFDAIVVIQEIKGSQYHVVHVGSFATRNEARSILGELREKTGIKAFIQKTGH